MLTFTVHGNLTALLGEDAAENQELCRRAHQNDLWFHLDGQPSPHCILQCGASEPPRQAILECARLVKQHSKGKRQQRVGVIYIQAKYVSRRGLQQERTGTVRTLRQPQRIIV